MAWNRWIVRVNNWIRRWSFSKIYPQQILILLPRCLQHTRCINSVVENVENCKQCGRCPIGNILKLAQQYRCRICLASGGQQAIAMVKNVQPRAVIAVACYAELVSGIFSVFPLPVYAIANDTPNGPCQSTHVDISEIEQVLKRITREVIYASGS